MPIYEFKCEACEKQSEFRIKISDNNPETCPECHSGPLKKLLSKTSFQLKGEGWYVTDFRGDKKPQDKDTGKEDSSAVEAKTTDDKSSVAKDDSGSKAESKPAPSKESTPSESKPASSTKDA